jgi:hypothetical protein
MKNRTPLLAFLVLATIASAKDDKISIVRAYKQDQTAVYAVQIDQMLGSVQMSMTVKEHVNQVNADGSADCQVQAIAITHTNDPNSTSKDGKPFAVRFDRSGAVVTGGNGLISVPFLLGSPYGLDSGLTVGQSVAFNRPDPSQADVVIKGSTKLVSVSDGFATVTVTADRVDKKAGPSTHTIGTFTYSVKNWELTKSDVTMTQRSRPHTGRTHIISELQS